MFFWGTKRFTGSWEGAAEVIAALALETLFALLEACPIWDRVGRRGEGGGKGSKLRIQLARSEICSWGRRAEAPQHQSQGL